MTSSHNREETLTIIGCGGFIGLHILERILSTTGLFVYGFDIDSRKIEHLLGNSRFEFRKTDIHDRSVTECISKSSTAIALAAHCNPSLYNTVPLEVIDSNLTAYLNLLKYCCGHKNRLIYFSTSEVYGKTATAAVGEPGSDERERLREDSSPLILGPVRAQRWSYAASRQMMERMIYAYGFEKGLDYTIIRPFNLIGPGMDYLPGVDGEGIPGVFACFMEALLKGKPLRLVGGGVNRRCFTFIDDAVDAVMAVLRMPLESNREIFNIGNPKNEITIRDLATLMIRIYKEIRPELSGKLYDIKHVNPVDFYGPGYEDSGRRLPDISKAFQKLKWVPKTRLEDALRITIKAYIDQYENKLL